MNRVAAAQAIEAFLRALGHEPSGPLAETPALVAEAWCADLLDGYAADPAELLREAALPAGDGARGMVTVRELAVTTMCPHHLMVAHGTGEIVYLPGDRVVGFGGLSRALRAVTHRLVLQEEAGAQIARLLVEAAGARGAACRLVLQHTCLLARGAREHSARVESLALEGSFASAGADRDLALAALGAVR